MQDSSAAPRRRLHRRITGDNQDLREEHLGAEAMMDQWLASLGANQERQFQRQEAREEAAYLRFARNTGVEPFPARRRATQPGRHRRSSGAAPVRSRGGRRATRSSAKSGDSGGDGPGEPSDGPSPDPLGLGASEEVQHEHVARHAQKHGVPALLAPPEFGSYGLAIYCRLCGKPVLWKLGDHADDGSVPLVLGEVES